MNQYSYNLYRLIPFVVKNETDLVVVSAYFNQPIVGSDKRDSEVTGVVGGSQNDTKKNDLVLKNQDLVLKNQDLEIKNQDLVLILTNQDKELKNQD
jgi:hypothetical protein